MPKRNANSPWGSSYKEGLPTTSVNDSVDIDQMVRPMLDCGVISKETGQWEGITTSDPQFIGITIALGVANGADVLFPDTDAHPNINMEGFTNLFIAIKSTQSGNSAIRAVMGPNTLPFGGLTPVDSAASLRVFKDLASGSADLGDGVVDAAESLTANVWNIFYIPERCENQRNMQFQITNNSGSEADMEFAFMRIV